MRGLLGCPGSFGKTKAEHRMVNWAEAMLQPSSHGVSEILAGQKDPTLTDRDHLFLEGAHGLYV